MYMEIGQSTTCVFMYVHRIQNRHALMDDVVMNSLRMYIYLLLNMNLDMLVVVCWGFQIRRLLMKNLTLKLFPNIRLLDS